MDGKNRLIELQPCINRKGQTYNERFIMTCGGVEVVPEECIGCTGKMKTGLTIGQLLAQKAKELDMVLKRKGAGMKWMSSDEIATRLEIGCIKQERSQFWKFCRVR